ncbi:hypothetical protein B9Z45_03015 [Limnohabitans sp. 2KL-17]|uniref:pentapeptide repeat-containing protein n=1 Tax=Limnohabitans sp. 2KL-17 TaxID=1100704 RepID=UPI000D34B17F|nr:pentapeptide repeat-containing protein [Limnohabitans sp. 2KL-17]PUE62792.1 hypothetical protein B9Z45_03015 [Limnohabitans sp. 2KL-17]
MSEHPDIEKLPLEIDGIPVRETIREIFRDPENGTPDNISKAGCLALALKSNEVGGEGKGYVVWNAWRRAFPSHRKWSPAKGQSRSQTLNWSNISDFGNFDGRLKNFAHFLFDHGADFTGAWWDFDLDFRGATIGDDAIFAGANFGSWANFQGSQWGNFGVFLGGKWGSNARFEAAIFGVGCDFSLTSWEDANFRGAMWGRGTRFCASQWQGYADFSAAEWNELLDFFQTEQLWVSVQQRASKHNTAPNTICEVSFSGAEFQSQLNFTGRQFVGTTLFTREDYPLPYRIRTVSRDPDGKALLDNEGSPVWEDWANRQADTVFMALPPFFHGCELHQDTSFEGAKFPKARGSEEAARAYRTLKLAFSKQQAIREEQRFFRLEMAEETLRETGIKRGLFFLYKRLSDYGFSVKRPLMYGLLGVAAMTVISGLLSWLGQCGLSVQTCYFAPQWLGFSLLQTLPLPGLDTLSAAASKAFWPEGAWWSLVLSALMIAHKTISLAALFLIGLGLRNLFKLK